MPQLVVEDVEISSSAIAVQVDENSKKAAESLLGSLQHLAANTGPGVSGARAASQIV